MNIVIDCRYLGMSGIGRFLRNIISNIDFKKNNYIMWGKKKDIKCFENLEYIIDEISPFSSKSMFTKAVHEINKNDALFTPNFIIPFGVRVNIYSVIHDMILLDIPELNKNFLEYKIKRYLYRRCLRKSTKIFTVSKFSKDRIVNIFPKYKSKIEFHYQGVNQIFLNRKPIEYKHNCIIFVGNIKKHKGLSTLIDAFEKIRTVDSSYILYIVGDSKTFRNSDTTIEKRLNQTGIIFTGKIDDNKLIEYVSKSKFLISPSLYEGFGIPPLEAIYLGTKPIISDILVYKEVYGNLDVVFFKSKNSDELAKKILTSSSKLKVDFNILNEKFNNKKFADAIINSIHGKNRSQND